MLESERAPATSEHQPEEQIENNNNLTSEAEEDELMDIDELER